MGGSDKKLVLFGAGRIGRSFIGQLFSHAGFEVVFIDINEKLITELNLRGQYKVIIKNDDGDEVLYIKNVRGISLNHSARVINELAGADIAALSVGQQGLPTTFPLIAKALLMRREQLGDKPLDFIIAENMRNADKYLQTELSYLLTANYPFEELVGLVETSIGKMVPIMLQNDLDEDPLQVFAEPYNTLIVAKNGFKNPIPVVDNMEPKVNIKAWVDRKLFIHNLGHATAAYLGFLKHPQAIYIYEVLNDPEIFAGTRSVMLQSADILMSLYPGEFTFDQIETHIDDLLRRFRNKALGDTVFRVGCDLYRKLSPEDRMAAPIKAAISLNKPYNLILNALLSAVSFRAEDEYGKYFQADEAFFTESSKGINHILKTICKLEIII
jgi:mannitol-1-phosphate 5-dehydrogenase